MDKQFLDTIVTKQEEDTIKIKDFLEKNLITTKGSDVPNPIFSFEALNLPGFLKENLKCFKDPTPIQSVSIPIVFKGEDLVGIAQTGSGKTLSFVLPIIAYVNYLRKNNSQNLGKNPKALILAPTRELAQQINEVVVQFTKGCHIKSLCVYGGTSRNEDVAKLRKRVDILTATPGRLNDLLSSQDTDISQCHFLVLDEADQMLDMGFEPQIRSIIKQIQNPKRQTLMWSATWPVSVKILANDYLKNSMQVCVGSATEDLTANTDILQHVYVCQEHEKMERLKKLLKELGNVKILVFVLRKNDVDKVVWELQKLKYNVVGLHGKKAQNNRNKVLSDFKGKNLKLLVATDVAARGLDIDDIKYVINYDFPLTMDKYIHRIGRTGRKGQKGTSYTFFTKEDATHLHELISVLQKANQEVCPELEAMKNRGLGIKRMTDEQRYARGKFRIDPDMPKAKHFKFSDD